MRPLYRNKLFRNDTPDGGCRKNDAAELVLVGMKATYPLVKYSYVVSAADKQNKGMFQASRFTEKSDVMIVEKLISEGAFRLGYMTNIVARCIKADTFAEIYSRYSEFPKICRTSNSYPTGCL